MKKLKLSIQGMHCASCSSNIERSLKKVSGVKSVTANAITNKAFVEADEGVKEEDMRKAVDKVGYKVLAIEEN